MRKSREEGDGSLGVDGTRRLLWREFVMHLMRSDGIVVGKERELTVVNASGLSSPSMRRRAASVEGNLTG